MIRPSKTWVDRFQKGPHHQIPMENFKALQKPGRSLFESTIQGTPIDLYVYNADSGDMVFGRADLRHQYPRELAHHIGLVRHYLHLRPGLAEKRFAQGALDIAVDHKQKEVYFKHLTLGLEDMVFPEELEWVTHIGSLQDMAMKALRHIGMPSSYHKEVVKANEWARIRTGLMRGVYIPYEEWKKRLKGGSRP